MMTYTPVPFMDAAPVNDLVHKSAITAHHLTLRDNKQCFKAGGVVRQLTKLSAPHIYNRLATHSAINATYLNNIYIAYTPGVLCVPSNTFTYSPHIYNVGGVSREQGGIIFSAGGKLHHVGGFYNMPGVSPWVGVTCSIGVQFTASLRSNIYHKLPKWILFNLTCIDQTARKSYMLPMCIKLRNYQRFDMDVERADRYGSGIMVEVNPATVVYKGTTLYAQIDGEFEEIGTVG